jgi:hypothetical protein
MAVTFFWAEDNGASTGSPAKGTSRTVNVSNVNWKNVDDTTTAYSSSPISAGNNSFDKFQFGIFSGTFNQVSNGLWQHVSGTFGAGITLKGINTSGYTTPATTANSNLIHNLTATGNIATGLAVLFGTVGPQQAGAATLAATGYSQYLASQLQTLVSASPGDTASDFRFCLRFDQN